MRKISQQFIAGCLAISGASVLTFQIRAQEPVEKPVAVADVDDTTAEAAILDAMQKLRGLGMMMSVEAIDRNSFVTDPASLDTFSAPDWIAELPHLTLDEQKFWIAEGDLLLDLAGLSDHIVERELLANEQRAREARRTRGITASDARGVQDDQQQELVGEVAAGTSRVMRWRPGKKLTYRVAKKTFPSPDKYEKTVRLIEGATSDWEEVCGVDFEHDKTLDDVESLGSDGCVFVVRYTSSTGSSGGLIASAFFPWYPAQRRILLVTPLLFESNYDPRGVIRHECGHILGLRHEHVRPGSPKDCPKENVTDLAPLTPSDPYSVMHYFCGGIGSKDLRFTALDRAGAVALYGRPHIDFEYLE